ncbi:MAG TPA: zf-HC2 domain-containing protein [Thermoanaerobaculia bacterium]|nr:zf-HC2 domain-containing protein [Thermoanaerobaculia bacterium]
MSPNLTDDEIARARQRIAATLIGNADEWHPDPELLIGRVDGTLSAIDRDVVEPHLADCMQCRREARDLETFARGAAKPQHRWAMWTAAAAAVLLIAMLYPAFYRSSAPSTHATAAVTLVDSGRSLSVSHDGHINGLKLAADAESRLAAALMRGTIAEPARVAALRRETESLRGASSTGAFSPLVPIGCVVVTQQPAFEWTAVPGARYKVEVFGDQFRPVAQSELLDVNRWTVPQPLAHGEIYAWQVTAYKPNGETTTSPAPPAPEARFAVIDVNEAARIDELQQMQPRSHLALGVAYAEAGAAAEAERELEALSAENRGSEVAARLLRTVRARR